MYIQSSVKVAFEALGKNRFRSLLTMLGIIHRSCVGYCDGDAIGIDSSAEINARIISFGTNLLTINPVSVKSKKSD